MPLVVVGDFTDAAWGPLRQAIRETSEADTQLHEDDRRWHLATFDALRSDFMLSVQAMPGADSPSILGVFTPADPRTPSTVLQALGRGLSPPEAAAIGPHRVYEIAPQDDERGSALSVADGRLFVASGGTPYATLESILSGRWRTGAAHHEGLSWARAHAAPRPFVVTAANLVELRHIAHPPERARGAAEAKAIQTDTVVAFSVGTDGQSLQARLDIPVAHVEALFRLVESSTTEPSATPSSEWLFPEGI